MERLPSLSPSRSPSPLVLPLPLALALLPPVCCFLMSFPSPFPLRPPPTSPCPRPHPPLPHQELLEKLRNATLSGGPLETAPGAPGQAPQRRCQGPTSVVLLVHFRPQSVMANLRIAVRSAQIGPIWPDSARSGPIPPDRAPLPVTDHQGMSPERVIPRAHRTYMPLHTHGKEVFICL